MSKYQVMPPLSDEQYAALKADISAAGVRVPIEVDEHGEIIDGHHRKQIATELGVDCPEVVVRGLEEFEKVDRAFVLNATRRHFDREQKRAVVVKSLKLHPRLADREHGRRCGVSHPTVAGVRAALEAAGQLESFTSRLGGDGRERPAHNEPIMPTPADLPAQDRQEGKPGDEDGAPTPSAAQPLADSVQDRAGDETDTASSRGSSVDPEQAPTGVTAPAPPSRPGGSGEEPGRDAEPVPAPETDDEQVKREIRERATVRFCEGLVNLALGLPDDLREWLDEVYLPGSYKVRDMPKARDAFTPAGLKATAARLHALADHLQETGQELL